MCYGDNGYNSTELSASTITHRENRLMKIWGNVVHNCTTGGATTLRINLKIQLSPIPSRTPSDMYTRVLPNTYAIYVYSMHRFIATYCCSNKVKGHLLALEPWLLEAEVSLYCFSETVRRHVVIGKCKKAWTLPISSPCPAAHKTCSSSGDKINGIPFSGIFATNVSDYTRDHSHPTSSTKFNYRGFPTLP